MAPLKPDATELLRTLAGLYDERKNAGYVPAAKPTIKTIDTNEINKIGSAKLTIMCFATSVLNIGNNEYTITSATIIDNVVVTIDSPMN
ncbi:MAG: hypothetical protein WDO15_02985 [Bacteroidota bacterium]